MDRFIGGFMDLRGTPTHDHVFHVRSTGYQFMIDKSKLSSFEKPLQTKQD